MKKKLVIATGLALIAVLSLWLYSRSLQEEVAGGQKVQILVAGEDIPAGARVTKASLAVRDVPEAYVHQASIRKGEENQIIGRPVAVAALAGVGAGALGLLLAWPSGAAGRRRGPAPGSPGARGPDRTDRGWPGAGTGARPCPRGDAVARLRWCATRRARRAASSA